MYDYDAACERNADVRELWLVTRETDRGPGTAQEVKTPVREWVCPR